METELDFFTTTYHNFGRIKTTKWKADKVIDKLIYNELKKGKKQMTYTYDFYFGKTDSSDFMEKNKLVVEYVLSSESNEIKVVEMWRVGEDWSGEVKKQEHMMTWMSHESREALLMELDEDMTDRACKTGEFDMDTYTIENADFNNAINGVS